MAERRLTRQALQKVTYIFFLYTLAFLIVCFVQLFCIMFNRNYAEDRYKKGKAILPQLFNFGVATIDNKNWFYNIGFERQLIDNSVSFRFYIIKNV